MLFVDPRKLRMPTAEEALPGRAERMEVPERHHVLGTPLDLDLDLDVHLDLDLHVDVDVDGDGDLDHDRDRGRGPVVGEDGRVLELAMFGMGCFWGAERKLWQVAGVYSTAVGYAGGHTVNPTYREVCSGRTGHNEVVRVAFDPAAVSFEALLRVFWEAHDPTQGMRQGNDVGTQYRSGVYCYGDAQRAAAEASLAAYQVRLGEAGYGAITTEVVDAPPFYFAEDYHQQYLSKNPDGYCGLGGTGVSCPVGVGVQG